MMLRRIAGTKKQHIENFWLHVDSRGAQHALDLLGAASTLGAASQQALFCDRSVSP
jgi:hypothetical protein